MQQGHAEELSVVVIGGGPTGLAAAAHLHERGVAAMVLESGTVPAAAVDTWGHVSLFSPWSQLVDRAAARLLKAHGWTAPDAAAYPTGDDWRTRYLTPLWEALDTHADGITMHLGERVVAVSREGHDLMRDAARASAPFVVVVEGPEGRRTLRAGAVIDASGTLGTPSPLGVAGIPAGGEELARAQGWLTSAIPDPSAVRWLDDAHVVVVGAGHSASTALIALAARPAGRTTWVLRRRLGPDTLGGGEADGLERRGALGQRVGALIADGSIHVVEQFGVDRVIAADGGRGGALEAVDGRRIDDVDHVLSLTGYRPDLSLLAELRLDLDPSVQAPRRLAPLIDPNVHSCGSVPPHGVEELAHPEEDVYVVGMKSYGRAPTFLALTGFEQVRSVVASLAGDDEAAARVELTLPQTGVCGGSGLADTADSGLLPVAGGGGCC